MVQAILQVLLGAINGTILFFFAHKLNLVVSCALGRVHQASEIIECVKNVVTFFHKSSKATEMLSQMQTRLNVPNHKLIQQVVTRWNSVYYMLERYLEQREAIRTALCMLEKNDLVSADSNGYIQEMIRILKPFEAVTTGLSAFS